MKRQWIFPSMDGNEVVSRLSNELSVPIFLARVLMRNGLEDLNAATSFLEPRLRQLQDPFVIPEMEEAVARIRRAIECHEGIVLYGDYDVDGVASADSHSDGRAGKLLSAPACGGWLRAQSLRSRTLF